LYQVGGLNLIAQRRVAFAVFKSQSLVQWRLACWLEIISQISQPFSSISLSQKNKVDQPDFSPIEQDVCRRPFSIPLLLFMAILKLWRLQTIKGRRDSLF
jgi:hypothetical protein